jgi:AcrR family transcriptional regulator
VVVHRREDALGLTSAGEVGELFSHGPTDLSMRAVAAHAGVGVGTLYRNFPTREALVAAVYADEIA